MSAEFRFSPRSNNAHRINWRPWGQDALTEAKSTEKPILLSISAVWCHWCHVMDENTYSDPEVIRLTNESFIPVRVDADMRPDVDALYNQGGWPSTAVLTPDGDVLLGGTYVPPAEFMPQVSAALKLFTEDKVRIDVALSEIKDKIKETGRTEPRQPEATHITAVTQTIREHYDPRHGGFGELQKFPHPEVLDFLLQSAAIGGDHESGGRGSAGQGSAEQESEGLLLDDQTSDDQTSDDQTSEGLRSDEMLIRTLDAMLEGGLHDRVEGGFFRYSTLPDWSEPHYEKMLDSNASLLRIYSHAYMLLGKQPYKEAAKTTAAYITANLISPKGGFFGSQDADEEYYKQTERSGLTPPYVDNTVYADSSSMAISAFISAHAATKDKAYLKTAGDAMGFIMQEMFDKAEGVYHCFLADEGGKSLSGQLLDNCLFAHALLDFHNATGDKATLSTAATLGELITSRFYDAEEGRFKPSIVDAGIRPTVTSSFAGFGAMLSNIRAALLLARLSRIPLSRIPLSRIPENDAAARSFAMQVLASFGDSFDTALPSSGLYGTAVRQLTGEPLAATLVTASARKSALLSALNSHFIPNMSLTVLDIEDDKEEITKKGFQFRESLYLCIGKACTAPVTKASELEKELRRLT